EPARRAARLDRAQLVAQRRGLRGGRPLSVAGRRIRRRRVRRGGGVAARARLAVEDRRRAARARGAARRRLAGGGFALLGRALTAGTWGASEDAHAESGRAADGGGSRPAVTSG